ncbi:hypothetical protein Pelo_18317 [Pelomyxa schiedti]|nr:hypothetical protein Pelo_18317 [Pelomyxa schiedti]
MTSGRRRFGTQKPQGWVPLDCDVAIKSVHISNGDWKSLKAELKIGRILSHPNVLPIITYYESPEDNTCIVMPRKVLVLRSLKQELFFHRYLMVWTIFTPVVYFIGTLRFGQIKATLLLTTIRGIMLCEEPSTCENCRFWFVTSFMRRITGSDILRHAALYSSGVFQQICGLLAYYFMQCE